MHIGGARELVITTGTRDEVLRGKLRVACRRCRHAAGRCPAGRILQRSRRISSQGEAHLTDVRCRSARPPPVRRQAGSAADPCPPAAVGGPASAPDKPRWGTQRVRQLNDSVDGTTHRATAASDVSVSRRWVFASRPAPGACRGPKCVGRGAGVRVGLSLVVLS